MITQANSSPPASLAQLHAEASGKTSALAASRAGPGAQEQADSAFGDDHGDAVVLTISENALDQGTSETNSLALSKPPSDEKITAHLEELKRGMQLQAFQNSIELNKNIVSFEKERIEFLEKVEPTAPRVLVGEEAEDTLRMLEAFKEGDVLMGISETGRRSWTVDGLSYALEPDGTLTVGEEGVPETEEERQLWLNSSRERYDRSLEGLSRVQDVLAGLLQDQQEVIA